MSSRRGVLVLVVALVVAGAVLLVLAERLRAPGAPGAHQLLVYDVPAEIDESPPPYGGFSLAALRRERPSFYEVLLAIRDAADDDRVDGLVLHVDGVDWGWARIEEMRAALRAFRAAGKPVYASLAGGGEQEYLLASAASRLAMPAIAHLQLDGLALSATFLKGTYDKLGVHPNFAHVGRYKSAVESYLREDFSPPAREALDALLDDEYALLVDSIAVSRGLPPDSVRSLVDDGPWLASEARQRGLVDTLLSAADLDSLALHPRGRRLEPVPLPRYLEAGGGGGGERIALVVANGTIVSGRSHETPWEGRQLGDQTLVAALRELRTRRGVRAVVLRVDSPGGSGDASDAIWQEVRRLRREKPVVVSMGNTAASGGYYIACGADVIVADPATLTGSIGVFGGKLNVLGLYRKLGLNVETLSRGRHAEMLSPFHDFTPEEEARFQRQLDDFYRVFVGRVAEGRRLDPAVVDSVGQGRVWSGVAARRLGLVDSLGGLETAVEVAKRRAGIPRAATIELELWPRQHRTFLQRWLGGVVGDEDDDTAALEVRGALAAALAAARFPAGEVLALMPCTVRIR